MAMQDMNDQVMARLAKLDKFKEMGVDDGCGCLSAQV